MTKRMRVLIYALNYAPEPTGSGKYTGEMAAWLSEHGHEVNVICGLPHYPEWKVSPPYRRRWFCRERVDGVEIARVRHYVPSADRLGGRARIWLETSFSLTALRYWIPRFYSRRKPDVVVGVMPPLQIGLWPILYSWLRGVPFVLHIQDLQVDAAVRLNMLRSKWLGALLYRMESVFLKAATRVSTITSAMKQRVIDKGAKPDRVWLFPNWAELDRIKPQERYNEFRTAQHVEPDSILVMYAGNMGEKQGLEVAVRAAELLVDEADICFILAGSGGARSKLEGLVKDLGIRNVSFLGVQPSEVLPQMLAAADIHLVVQKREAADLVMPSKLTNILAAGRASVVTADPDTALGMTVEENDLGIVAPPGDPTALAEAIRALARNEERRRQCGERARAYADQHLDRDQILGRFERDLISLCEEM